MHFVNGLLNTGQQAERTLGDHRLQDAGRADGEGGLLGSKGRRDREGYRLIWRRA